MKRNNPNTGLEFEKGFIDEETELVFLRYRNTPKADGFFREEWVTKEAWERKYKPGRKVANQRLNPKTAAPFQKGDTDDAGRIFRQYDYTRVLDNGNYVEVWHKNIDAWEKNKTARKQAGIRKNKKLKEQGRLNLNKRLNPITNKPFKRGDYFEGKYFIVYDYRNRKLGTDYFFEHWANQESWEKYRQNERTPQRLATVLCNHARSRAKKYGGKFTLKKEDIAKRIAEGKCEVTKIPFQLEIPNSQSPQPFSPSLDRIDNDNRDYSPENVRVVISAFNNMRGALDEKTLKEIVTAYLRNNPD